jgi:squalene-hopene/tetraprenyl-beta-curcumene cyclase
MPRSVPQSDAQIGRAKAELHIPDIHQFILAFRLLAVHGPIMKQVLFFILFWGRGMNAALSVCVFFCAMSVEAAEQNPPRPVAIGAAVNVSLQNEVKRAIDKGLEWLEKSQNSNGFWSTADHPAITGLALTATRARADKKIETDVAKRGYNYLLSCVQPDGGIYRKDLPSYNTSLALVALVAANRAEYQPVIAKARKFLIGLQVDYDEQGKADNPLDGGIGYGIKDKRPDLSNTSLALEALYLSKQSRDKAGLAQEDDLNWAAAIRFIQACQNLPSHNSEKWASNDPQNKGGFIYAPGRSMAGETNLASGRIALRSYGSMSYAGLLSYIYADLKHNDPRVTAVMDWLRANFTFDENPGLGQQGLYYYYHTMAKALTLSGVDDFETRDGKNVHWREGLALKLINLQSPNGSWANDNGRWFEKDPALVTSYALIALGMIHPKL